MAVIFKVSNKSIQQAKAILDDATDLADQVESCALSLAAAYEELQSRKAQSRQKAKDAEKVAEYTDAISAGEMTVDQAIQKALEEKRHKGEALRRRLQTTGVVILWVVHQGSYRISPHCFRPVRP
jgi:hypothetical protein